MLQKNGTLVISLDFELFWGMHDVTSLKAYENNLLGTHQAVKEILNLFKVHNIHATWAIVGMLYYKDLNELKESIPKMLPSYTQEKLSPYYFLHKHSISKEEQGYFFAPNLIREIENTNYQEIATHTFSHFYTLEKGATKKAFTEDLQASLNIARKSGSHINTIIFPRNQINDSFMDTCSEHGITSYRGREDSFIYSYTQNDRRNYHIRALRLLDQYFNIFGHHTYKINNNELPINIPSSRFLMPYNKYRKWLEPLKLQRIKHAMTFAAKHNEIFHLWWHPHNFGLHLSENLEALNKILKHYDYLQEIYGFQSLNMNEITKRSTTQLDDTHQHYNLI